MKTFLCEIERDGKIHKAIVKADTEQDAVNDLSLNWRVVSIKEHKISL